jgi:aconitate hydratase
VKAQGLFWTPASPIPQFSENVELDLSTVVPALAGPKRPQDLIPLDVLKKTWEKSLRAPVKERGFALNETQLQKKNSRQRFYFDPTVLWSLPPLRLVRIPLIPAL